VSDGVLIRADARPQVAWKNGGGVTRALASFPDDAGMESFAWRLSAARVDVPGPFSHFAGVDRTLAILSGRLLLNVAGAAPITLTPHSAPYTFAGDVAAFGTPENGPVLDLNLMVRRTAGVGEMRMVSAGPIFGVGAGAILVATADMALHIGTRAIPMQACDAFRFDTGPDAALSVTAPAHIVSITLAAAV
jgi:environmental stress-induced protein Ves